MNYFCIDCHSQFNEMEQTNHEHKNGICPRCGGEDLVMLTKALWKLLLIRRWQMFLSRLQSLSAYPSH